MKNKPVTEEDKVSYDVDKTTRWQRFKKRLKAVFAIVMITMLAGCVTQERCLQRYPPEVKEITKLVTETKIVTRDTTIYVTMPAEVVVMTDTVVLDQGTGLINSKLSRLETSLAWSTAQIINSRLRHELYQKDTTIEHRLQNAIREVDRLEKELTERTTAVEVPRRLTWWQRLTIAVGTLTIGAGIMLLAIVLLGIFKIKLPFR